MNNRIISGDWAKLGEKQFNFSKWIRSVWSMHWALSTDYHLPTSPAALPLRSMVRVYMTASFIISNFSTGRSHSSPLMNRSQKNHNWTDLAFSTVWSAVEWCSYGTSCQGKSYLQKLMTSWNKVSFKTSHNICNNLWMVTVTDRSPERWSVCWISFISKAIKWIYCRFIPNQSATERDSVDLKYFLKIELQESTTGSRLYSVLKLTISKPFLGFEFEWLNFVKTEESCTVK